MLCNIFVIMLCCSINFKVDQTQLIAVIGPIGSGKSSLASAIIGDLLKTSGKFIIKVFIYLLIYPKHRTFKK